MFLGLSVAGLVTPAMLQTMAPHPIIFALANPDPEIGCPRRRRRRAPTHGRDRPLGLPQPGQQRARLPVHLPRRARRAARSITEAMKVAACAGAGGAGQEPVPESVVAAYGGKTLKLRPGVLHPQAVRPARVVVGGAGGGRGGDGVGRGLVLPKRTLFIGDTYINYDPTAEQLAELTRLGAEEVRRFGLTPRAALLSHSNFGAEDTPTAIKMRRALEILRRTAPDLEVDGEMHGDTALSADIRRQVFPNSTLTGQANLLIMPTLDAANIAFNLLKTSAGDGLTVGPMLLGAARPVHVLTPTATVRRIVNVTALLSVEAQQQARSGG
jgi:hypothetical protein